MHQWIQRQDALQEVRWYLCSFGCLIWNLRWIIVQAQFGDSATCWPECKSICRKNFMYFWGPTLCYFGPVCIWFCLFRFSSFSVGWIVIKIGSGQTQTKTKPHKYNYWILFSRKALTVLLAKTPNRKWVITLAKLLLIDAQFFFVSTPHCPENIMHISSATYWSKVINQKICSVIQYPIGVWPCSCYLQLNFVINP